MRLKSEKDFQWQSNMMRFIRQTRIIYPCLNYCWFPGKRWTLMKIIFIRQETFQNSKRQSQTCLMTQIQTGRRDKVQTIVQHPQNSHPNQLAFLKESLASPCQEDVLFVMSKIYRLLLKWCSHPVSNPGRIVIRI